MAIIITNSPLVRGGSANLSWTSVSGATNYRVKQEYIPGFTGDGPVVYTGTALTCTASLSSSASNDSVIFYCEYEQGGYWYGNGKTVNNSPESMLYWAPTVPASLDVLPNPPIRGKSVTISWGVSTDSDGDFSGYELERRFNSGSWTQVYKGSNRTYSETIPESWTSVAYRVRAYDAKNIYSGYRTSATFSIIDEAQPPAISGSNANLGEKNNGVTLTYTVTHPQSKATIVTENVGNYLIREYAATLGQQQTLTLVGVNFLQVLNGAATITITARDTDNQTATRIYTFTKNVTTAAVTLLESLPADDMPTKAVISATYDIASGAQFKFEICNNGNDSSPTWEDCTGSVINSAKFFFANTVKTAAKWGVKVRFTADRKNAVGACNITSIGGFFE